MDTVRVDARLDDGGEVGALHAVPLVGVQGCGRHLGFEQRGSEIGWAADDAVEDLGGHEGAVDEYGGAALVGGEGGGDRHFSRCGMCG